MYEVSGSRYTPTYVVSPPALPNNTFHSNSGEYVQMAL